MGSMISSDYLLHNPGGPSAPMRVLNRQVIPVLIDAAGGVEMALEQLASRIQQSPATSMGVALGVGALLSFIRPGRWRA
jgi:hypothetical protein